MYDSDYEESKLYESEETDISEEDGEFYVEAPPLETMIIEREIANPFDYDTDVFLENSGLNPDIYQDFDVRRFVRKGFRQCVDYLGFSDGTEGEHSEECAEIIEIDDNDIRITIMVTMTASNRCLAEFGFYVNE